MNLSLHKFIQLPKHKQVFHIYNTNYRCVQPYKFDPHYMQAML